MRGTVLPERRSSGGGEWPCLNLYCLVGSWSGDHSRWIRSDERRRKQEVGRCRHGSPARVGAVFRVCARIRLRPARWWVSRASAGVPIPTAWSAPEPEPGTRRNHLASAASARPDGPTARRSGGRRAVPAVTYPADRAAGHRKTRGPAGRLVWHVASDALELNSACSGDSVTVFSTLASKPRLKLKQQSSAWAVAVAVTVPASQGDHRRANTSRPV